MGVTQLNLSKQAAEKHIRALASDTKNVFIIPHAKQRQGQRHITRLQIIECLRKGRITEGPYRELKTGNWRMRIEYFTSGQNIITVAELQTNENNEKILVITTFFGS